MAKIFGCLLLCLFLALFVVEIAGQEFVINNAIGKYRVRAWNKRAVSRIRFLVVHHSVMRGLGEDEAELRAIQRVHVNGNGWPGISYHYVILRNGRIYQVNGHDDLTWTDTINVDSVAVLLHGYFHAPVNQQPTQAQLNSLAWLLRQLTVTFGLTHTAIRGHRDRSSTSCPGDTLYPTVTGWRNNGLPGTSNPPPSTVTFPINSRVCLRSAVNLRSGPCTDRSVITLILEGGSGTVVGGPSRQCGFTWHEVIMGQHRGWMANGKDSSGQDWLFSCGAAPTPTRDPNRFYPGDEVCLTTAVNLRQSRCTGALIATVPAGGRGTVNGAITNQPVIECGWEWYYVTMGPNVGWMARGTNWLIKCLGASTTDENGWDNSTALLPDEGFGSDYYSEIDETELNESLPLGNPTIYVGEDSSYASSLVIGYFSLIVVAILCIF